MIPIRDNVPSRSVPFVTLLLITACSCVFAMQLLGTVTEGGEPRDPLTERYGMVPLRLVEGNQPIVIQTEELHRRGFQEAVVRRERLIEPSAVNPWLTIFTCIFLHGGWLHFIGNMWVLWIFGDNVEDRLGHFKYLLFYVGSGGLASLAHFGAAAGSPIPTIGASGAIAGVMGAYFLLYPHAHVQTWFPIFPLFLRTFEIPAPIFLGVWFIMQLWSANSGGGGPLESGIAWWAHVGGFAAGMAIVLGMRVTGHLRPPPARYLEPSRIYRGRF